MPKVSNLPTLLRRLNDEVNRLDKCIPMLNSLKDEGIRAERKRAIAELKLSLKRVIVSFGFDRTALLAPPKLQPPPKTFLSAADAARQTELEQRRNAVTTQAREILEQAQASEDGFTDPAHEAEHDKLEAEQAEVLALMERYNIDDIEVAMKRHDRLKRLEQQIKDGKFVS
jgi:hypothetical protein